MRRRGGNYTLLRAPTVETKAACALIHGGKVTAGFGVQDCHPRLPRLLVPSHSGTLRVAPQDRSQPVSEAIDWPHTPLTKLHHYPLLSIYGLRGTQPRVGVRQHCVTSKPTSGTELVFRFTP